LLLIKSGKRTYDPRVGRMKASKVGQIKLSNATLVNQ